MCRAHGRRCLVHTPAARQAARAEASLLRASEEQADWYGKISPLPAKGTEPGSIQKAEAYSRWRLALYKIMKATTEAIVTLTAKRAALRIVRAEHAAERLSALRDDERREKAATCVAEVERLILESEEAIDALREAQDDVVRTRPANDWPSPKEVTVDLLIDAISERAEAEFQLQKAQAKMRPADSLPDPKTGAWTKAKENFKSAQMKLEFSLRHEALMRQRVDRIPTHEAAVATLSAAEARTATVKVDLVEAKRVQEALLAPGRPVMAVVKVAA